MEQPKKRLSVGDVIQGLVITIYAATRNEDDTEGRGPRIDNSYHLTEREAKIATSGIDVMGSDGKVESRLSVKIDEGLYLLVGNDLVTVSTVAEVEESKETVRKRALSKLTEAEKAALLGD